MYINPKVGSPTPVQPMAKIEENAPAAVTVTGNHAAITPDHRSDKVQISNAGRALAARDGAQETSSLSPERIAELRQRVLDGAYNSLEVVDEVARRILAKGDL
jgi:hypothetical protein